MKPISYELEAFFESFGGYMVTNWPRLAENGPPETLQQARTELALKQARNPNVEYRIVRATREVVE